MNTSFFLSLRIFSYDANLQQIYFVAKMKHDENDAIMQQKLFDALLQHILYDADLQRTFMLHK